jgi:PAS domain-containing protein
LGIAIKRFANRVVSIHICGRFGFLDPTGKLLRADVEVRMMAPRSQRLLLQIVTPLVTVGAAAYITHRIPGLHNRSSLFLFLAAVIFSTRVGGWVSGMFATILSVVVTTYFLPHSFHLLSTDILPLAIFLFIALAILSLHSARGRSDMALRASEQRLMLALDAAHMGVWDYNLLTRKFWWSKTLEVIYGRTAGDFPNTYGRFFGFIHFDDQPMFNRAITRTIDEGTDYEVDHRILLPDQSIRWVNTRGRVFFNQDSRAERIVGVATDITAKKKAENQPRMSHEDADESRLTTVG